MDSGELIIQFDAGTLVLDGASDDAQLPVAFKWDERVRRWRAPALAYRQVITEMTRRRLPHRDEARDYLEFNFRSKLDIEPRPYQQEALSAWQQGGRRGVVVLPTGAGKTFLAQMAIEMTGR